MLLLLPLAPTARRLRRCTLRWPLEDEGVLGDGTACDAATRGAMASRMPPGGAGARGGGWYGAGAADAPDSQCLSGFSQELGGSQLSQDAFRVPAFAY